MNLPKFEISEFGHPEASGVYLVCARGFEDGIVARSEHILYVGSSKNIGKRLAKLNHPYRFLFNRFKKAIVYVKFFLCSDYLTMEIDLIKHFNPIVNRHHKRG